MFFGDLFQRREFVNARVVHEHVERAERFLGFDEQAINVSLLGDIPLHRHGFATALVISLTILSAPALLEE